ncbi:probable glutathione S-transferase GSTU1 [Lolium rigidum]|uniref:probable glutathione S-transferase GSTU1 n=1 Tax=Lolium rigidum TaxID=89674 RepID=UPI001F5DB49B|nr:probable glutathione S-transferase GSTU1 [Lolium rigidum]
MASEKNVGLVLLNSSLSPFGQRCSIALAEKGLPHEYVEEDLAAKSDLLLRSNPVYKQVPVLLHDGRTIIESLIILQYLDEAFPDTRPLLPTDPYERAQARFWADYVDKKVYGCGSRLYMVKGEPQVPANIEMAEILKTLEGELGEKEFFGGEHGFGFLDIALVPFSTWFESFDKFWGVSVEEVAPKLAAWAARCMERESVSKNVISPEKVSDFIGEMRKDLGIE